MKFTPLRDQSKTVNTVLVGYVTATYRELEKLFGEPLEGDDYKISSLWVLEQDTGDIATLYDYKETDLYDDRLLSVEEFRNGTESRQWHIGGHTAVVARDLREFIQRSLAQSASPART